MLPCCKGQCFKWTAYRISPKWKSGYTPTSHIESTMRWNCLSLTMALMVSLQLFHQSLQKSCCSGRLPVVWFACSRLLPADLQYVEDMKRLFPLHVPAACRKLALLPEVPLHELDYISTLSGLTFLTLEMQDSDYGISIQFSPNFSVEPGIGHDAFMASLTCLPELQVLHLKRLEASAIAMGVIAQLSSLRHVEILHFRPIPCYFQHCTQLTHLALSSRLRCGCRSNVQPI